MEYRVCMSLSRFATNYKGMFKNKAEIHEMSSAGESTNWF